jgi:hypothetical protein
MNESSEHWELLLKTFHFHRESIPYYMHGSIIRYITHGINPGSFLMSVLTNDLVGAVSNADEQNLRILHVYVGFFYNHVPMHIWRTPENVKRHMESFND